MHDSYPRMLYHAILAPEGKRFENPRESPIEGGGWVDTPAKIQATGSVTTDEWLEGRVPATDDPPSRREVECAIWKTCAFSIGHQAISSPRAGGQYLIDRPARYDVEKLEDQQKAVLITHLNQQRQLGAECPQVTMATVDMIRPVEPLRVGQRARNLLAYIAWEVRNVGQTFSYWSGHEYAGRAMAYSESVQFGEVRYLIDYLVDMGWLARKRGGGATEYSVTVRGYGQLEHDEERSRRLPQGFVAMWFDAKLEEVFDDGFAKGIGDAGYKAFRVDKSYHNDKICDRIVAEIKRSKFLVADFTHGDDGARGGVYFEAGFAMGQGIPVFFTCRKDCMKSVHFDTRQYNHIVWTDVGQLRKELRDRISALVGDGPLRKNSAHGT